MVLGAHWGSNPAYFAKHVVEGQAVAGNRGLKQDYYSRAVEAGEPPGLWLGRGLGPLGLSGEVTNDQMQSLYGNLVHPTTGECLGTPLRHYASRGENLAKAAEKRNVRLAPGFDPKSVRSAIAAKTMTDRDVEIEVARHVQPETLVEMKSESAQAQRQSKTFIDLTFSPDKSISVYQVALEATGDLWGAEAIDKAQHDAVVASLDFISREAGLARAGYHGKKVGGRTSGRWMAAPDFTVAEFVHHLSRDGDPQLHTHAAVLNRVQCDDGVYRAIDGQAVSRVRSMAAAIYELTLEQSLRRELGIHFTATPDGKARRIAGVSQDVIDLFSKRTTVIEARVEQWKAGFREANDGAEPNERQIDAAMQQIALTSRKGKPAEMDARSVSVERWGNELGTARRDGLRGVLSDVGKAAMSHRRTMSRSPAAVLNHDAVVTQALTELGRLRAKWTRYDLGLEIMRALPEDFQGFTERPVEPFIDGLVQQALRSPLVARLSAPDVVGEIPPSLRMPGSDGSIYSPKDDVLYGLDETLSREQSLLGRAYTTTAPAVPLDVAERRLERSGLWDDQKAAVISTLTSGRNLEVLIGPAGTGKSYSMAALAKVWERHVGRGAVVGLTLSQSAADVLKDEGLSVAFNIDAWLVAQENGRHPLPRGALVIVDEASMAPTDKLARIAALTSEVGGKVLLTGDDHQLGGIESAGVMALIAADRQAQRVGAVHELTTVTRFRAQWEREASLRLRRGEASVLDLYERHGRIVGGTLSEMTTAACEAYVTDVLANKTSLLVVPTAAEAAGLSSRIRVELVNLGVVANGDTLTLANGCVAGPGDMIQTRKNDRKLRDPFNRSVTNRDVYKVVSVGTAGAGSWLMVTKENGLDADGVRQWGPLMRLDGDYCAEHVELAYAVTVHAAQGRTVDVCHDLVDDSVSLESLYVGMSRGRLDNQAYVVTEAAEVESIDEPELVEREPVDVLRRVLGQTSATLSATATMREQFDAAESLARLGPIWADVCGRIEAERHADLLLRAFREADVNRWSGQRVTDSEGSVLVRNLSPTQAKAYSEAAAKDPAYPAFMRVVASAVDQGHDPAEMLKSLIERREFQTADSLCEVLHWRAERYLETTPPPQTELVRSDVTASLRHDVTPERVVGAMSEPRQRALVSDPALPSLVALVQYGAEQGLDAQTLVSGAEASRGFSDAASIAKVMHYRVKLDLEHRGIEIPEHLSAVDADRRQDRPLRFTYLERTPEPEMDARTSLVDDDVGLYARRLAVAMDNRVVALGERVAENPPEWATKTLGPVPDTPIEREDWTWRAGYVEAYREQYVDGNRLHNAADPIGFAPSQFLSPDRYESWRIADHALGRLDRSREVAQMTDRQLRQHIAAWRRDEAEAPKYQGVQLRLARDELRRTEAGYQRNLASLRGREAGPRVAALGEQVKTLRGEVGELDVAQSLRDDWWAGVQDDLTLARRAADELRQRHPELGEEDMLHPEEMSPHRLRAYEREIERSLPTPPVEPISLPGLRR